MEIRVRVYINSAPVASEELHRYRIRNAAIDRIVNDVVRRCGADTPQKTTLRAAQIQHRITGNTGS